MFMRNYLTYFRIDCNSIDLYRLKRPAYSILLYME
jgi:hypothetical protein